MIKGITNQIFSLLIVSLLLSLNCSFPDPTDPQKTSITAVFKNAESVVLGNSIVDTVGKPLSIGAALYLPVNFDSISFVIKENNVVTVDTTFKTFDDEYYYDTVWYTRTFSSEGILNVAMTPFSTPILQPLSINIPIVVKTGTPVLISFSKNNSTATGSMQFQTCTSGKAFKLPENSFINPGYQFSGWATTPTGPVVYKDKDEVTLGTEDLLLFAIWVDQDSVSPIIAHAPSQLIAGKADTLFFAVDNTSQPDPLTISLLTVPPLNPAIFSIVPTGPDTIKIAIAQSAHTSTDTIRIITNNGTKSDTLRYPITLVSPETALWNITSLNLNAIEGSLFKQDLSQYISTANGAGISLSSDSGTIDKTTWSFTPKWGCAEKVTATITAKKGNLSLALSLNLTIATGDTTKPQLSLVDTSLDGKKISSSQITVDCKATDTGAGVDSVVFTCGAQEITGTLLGEDIYRGVITGLVHKTPTQITITTIDKSRQKNKTTLTFTVTRDSTLLDGEVPVIVRTSGPESGTRVKTAKDSLTFTVTDNSGIDSAWWTLNDTFVAVVPLLNENKCTVIYTLPHFGNNVIKLYAKDKSSAGNTGSQTVTLGYNTEPTAISLTAPAANATGVSTSPTFKWSGGDDADGDGVTFTVNYGTSQTSLSNTATVTGITATLSSPLAYTKTYYWQVTATSASTAYPDKVQSEVGTFSTEGSLPTISAQPQPLSAEEGQSVTFSVTAGGFGTLSYQWRQNGSIIPGATGISYTIASVSTGMNNNTYDCVVKNEVGEVTSNAAKLTVSSIPSFTVSFDMHGGTAINSQTVLRGGHAQEPPTPTRTNYAFKGWYTSSAFTTEFNFTTPITANQTVHAKWVDVYTVTYYPNTADGGDIPTDTKKYASGDMVTVAANTGNLSKNNYTFAGWTINAQGTGNVYNSPNTIQMGSEALSLYAKWEMKAPTITTPITNKNCPVNDSVTFTVVATGEGLSYTWQQNNITISGATGSSYTTSRLTVSDLATARTYKCIVTNSAGSKDCSASLSVSTVNDFDDNVYHQVKIGTQVWLMENLKTTHYRDGTEIKLITDGTSWAENLTQAAYCWANYSSSAKAYGAYYNWYAASSNNITPVGWRLPTEAEWTALFNLNDNEGCPYISEETYWEYFPCTHNDPANNSTGFSAMGNGFVEPTGGGSAFMNGYRSFADWWTTEEKRFKFGQNMGWNIEAQETGGQLLGCGIRCIKE